MICGMEGMNDEMSIDRSIAPCLTVWPALQQVFYTHVPIRLQIGQDYRLLSGNVLILDHTCRLLGIGSLES